MAIRIPDELEPAEVGGSVTKAEYIKDGNKTQHEINQNKVDDVESPQEDGMYVRKNGVWSKLIIDFDDETSTLIIDTRGEINNN